MDQTVVHQPPEEKRLNPFAFPAETNVRFNLLIVAMIMLAIDVFVFINVAIRENTGFNPNVLVPELDPASDVSTLISENIAVMVRVAGAALLAIAIVALVVGVVLALASALYRGHPARIRRQRQLSVFPADKDPKFTAEVEALAARAGISPAPAIEIGEKAPSADGQVFGFKGRYSVRLGARMRLVMRKALPVFRGTVLHEMAHIANGDVSRAYFSQSLWVSVIWLVLVPLALFFLFEFGQRTVAEITASLLGGNPNLSQYLREVLPSYLWVNLQLAGLLALFAALRGSLLRTREVYADWRAALWGARDGLEAILAATRVPQRGQWLRLWQLHPVPGMRLNLLNNPRRLFAIANDIPLLTGALVGASTAGAIYIVVLVVAAVAAALTAAQILVTVGPFGSTLAAFVGDIIFAVVIALVVVAPFFSLAYLTSGSLGLQAQRDAVAAAAIREQRGIGPYLRLIFPAILYALGLEIGFALAPISALLPVINLITFEGNMVSLLAIPPGMAVWLIIVTLLLWMWLMWARCTAQRWMARHTGVTPPDRRRRFLQVYLSIILGFLLIPILLAQLAVWDPVIGIISIISWEAAIVIFLVGISVAAGIAVVGWLLVEVLSLGRITCPACHTKTKQRHAVGRQCEHCGAELAEWIIARTRAA